MHETEFKAQFITTFLATHAAVNHADNCMRDRHFASVSADMCEEAECLAQHAWEENPYKGTLFQAESPAGSETEKHLKAEDLWPPPHGAIDSVTVGEVLIRNGSIWEQKSPFLLKRVIELKTHRTKGTWVRTACENGVHRISTGENFLKRHSLWITSATDELRDQEDCILNLVGEQGCDMASLTETLGRTRKYSPPQVHDALARLVKKFLVCTDPDGAHDFMVHKMTPETAANHMKIFLNSNPGVVSMQRFSEYFKGIPTPLFADAIECLETTGVAERFKLGSVWHIRLLNQ